MTFIDLVMGCAFHGEHDWLTMIDRDLLDKTEREVVDFSLKYVADFGQMPSVSRLKSEPFGYILSSSMMTEPVADLARGASHELASRIMSRQSAAIDCEYMRARKFDVESYKKMVEGVDTALRFGQKSTVTSIFDDGAWPEDGSKSFGFPLGIPALDKITLMNGDFSVVAARPGVGKTFFLCRWAVDWARLGKKVLFMSCEMPKRQVLWRVYGALGGFNPRVFRHSPGATEMQRLRDVVTTNLDSIKEGGGDLVVMDSSEAYLPGLVSRLELGKDNIVIIDSMYLMKGMGEATSTWEKVKSLSNNLKRAAIDYDVPIIASTQMNRGDGELDLDRIAYSDAISQDADFVASLTPEDVKRHEVGITVLKSRHEESSLSAIVKTDWDTMRLLEVEVPVLRLGGKA